MFAGQVKFLWVPQNRCCPRPLWHRRGARDRGLRNRRTSYHKRVPSNHAFTNKKRTLYYNNFKTKKMFYTFFECNMIQKKMLLGFPAEFFAGLGRVAKEFFDFGGAVEFRVDLH